MTTTIDAPEELHHRASSLFGDLVHRVQASQWHLPTPCTGWDVRALVNHVTAENLWTAPLMAGRTLADVGDAYDGDVLGDDPVAEWDAAAAQARQAVDEPGALDRTVHVSFGDIPATEYVAQLFADHLIHAWDLAQAIAPAQAVVPDARLDDDLVAACAAWFDGVEEMYRSGGAIAERAHVPLGADAQTVLLARFGRSVPRWAIIRFQAAFDAQDVDAIMQAMTDDCVFESTGPAPDGERHEGREAVRAVWEQLFAASPSARFDEEEVIVQGDRGTLRWTYHFDGGHVRGVDVLRVRDGKVAEKLSYVKG